MIIGCTFMYVKKNSKIILLKTMSNDVNCIPIINYYAIDIYYNTIIIPYYNSHINRGFELFN